MLNLVFEPDTGPLRRILRDFINGGTSCHQHQDARAPGRDTSDAQPVSRAGRPLMSGPQDRLRECEPGNGIDRHELHRRVLPGPPCSTARRASPEQPRDARRIRSPSTQTPRRCTAAEAPQMSRRCHQPRRRSRISKIPPTQTAPFRTTWTPEDVSDYLCHVVPQDSHANTTDHGPRSGPGADQVGSAADDSTLCHRSEATVSVYHRQTKNLLVSYSPKKPGFFQRHEGRRLTWPDARQAPSPRPPRSKDRRL